MSRTAPYVLHQRGHRCTAGEVVARPPRSWKGQTADEARAAQLTAIGQVAGFETLETRNSDWADFQTVAAWQMKAALEAAYAAGRASAQQG